MGEDQGEQVGVGDGVERGGHHRGQVGQRRRAEQERLQGGGGCDQVWGIGIWLDCSIFEYIGQEEDMDGEEEIGEALRCVKLSYH